jgi:transcription elongation GreA/GreB family factor
MKNARVVDPASQPDRDVVRFGATVELTDEEDARRTFTLVGDDEAEPRPGVSPGAARWRARWSAPESATSGRCGYRRARKAGR